jgi:hemerythrin superfamily protein
MIELDARTLAPAQILRQFDALPEGGCLILRNDARAHFHGLRAERGDVVGWIPVEEEKVEVWKLKPKETESEICSYFGRDHDEIDVLFGYLRADARASRPAAALFDEFDRRLERHIRWEEEILFPAVEAKMPDLADGPGRVMRWEHEEIRRYKGEAGRLLRGGLDFPRAAELLESTLYVLLDHNRKEESIYYPLADKIFTPKERADVLARVRAMV